MLFDLTDLTINEQDVIHMTGDSGEGKSLFGMSLMGFYSTQSEVDYTFDIRDLNVADYQTVTPNVKVPWNFYSHNINDAWNSNTGQGQTITIID